VYLQLLSDFLQCVATLFVNKEPKLILQATVSVDEFSSNNGTSQDFSAHLTEILQRKMCDTEWEIRDTALEFISRVFTQLKGLGPFYQPCAAL
jgi:hypothetical protein